MVRHRKSSWTLTARWIFPVEGPPLERSVITIRGDHIRAVEPRGDGTPDRDFGDAVILPGLVNAHTHLDLARLAEGTAPVGDFTAWLKAVIQQRRSLSPAQIRRNIRAGLRQSLAYGTTLLGDISSQGMSWPVLAKTTRCRAVVFYEMLGLLRTRAHQNWAAACEWLRRHPRQPTCRPGLSPHAPYSVRTSLFGAAARLSEKQSIPLAIHLAETPEELQLLHHHDGPFLPFLSELGVWDAQGLTKGIDQVLQLNAGAANVLLVHGNYLNPNASLPRGASVVYCPRTHAAFGHAPHPFRRLLAEGVRIALGTDSLASNPDLDVLGEVRFLHRLYPDLPGAALLRMATLSGAEALGWQDETGSLRPGKSADLIVLPLASGLRQDPYAALLASAQPVQAVLSRGRWLSSSADAAS
jgi:cytosine/adenosine deaminase-related metal-dependent hydrolase